MVGCVTTELEQLYVEEHARLIGERDSYLHYCFVSGYQGIGCGEDYQITQALGHGLSNRERAECDGIIRTIDSSIAANEAREKSLDQAYDEQHGLTDAEGSSYPPGYTKQECAVMPSCLWK